MKVPYCAHCTRHASVSSGIDRPFSEGNQFMMYALGMAGAFVGVLAVLELWEGAPGWAPIVGMVVGILLGAWVGAGVARLMGIVTDRVRDAMAERLKGPDCTTAYKAVSAQFLYYGGGYRLGFSSEAYRSAFEKLNHPFDEASPTLARAPLPAIDPNTEEAKAFLEGLGITPGKDEG